MKNINSRGFTLIELLAVVVILAIVMGIAASSVINSLNSSRRSTLLSESQNVANKLNEWLAADQLVVNEKEKKLGKDFVNFTQSANVNKWICLGNSGVRLNNYNSPIDFKQALGLSDKDFTLGGGMLRGTGEFPANSSDMKDYLPLCSAVRYNKSIGSYEVLLIAKRGGRYYTSKDSTFDGTNYTSDKNYAISSASSYASNPQYQ